MSANDTALLDIAQNPLKQDFPLLERYEGLSFLDSAATAQRPRPVLDALTTFYETMNANPLRGLYKLSVEATDAILNARRHVADFIGAHDEREIVFTRNTSESLNLLSHTLAPKILQPGDEVVISIMEHHSNLIPWQQVCAACGARLIYMYCDKEGIISDEEIEAKIGPHAKIVSVAHVSNVLGVTNPIAKIARRAHAMGAFMVVDAAQSVPHIKVNIDELDCDFLAFSAHKLGGPMGIGVLWGKLNLLEFMPPFLTGGEMIDSVTQTTAVWAPVPEKFEAGTQDAAGMFALDAALTYMENNDPRLLEERERKLTSYLVRRLQELPFVEVIGSSNPDNHIGVASFNVEGIHPHDVASILDTKDVAIRAGHHCAEPLLTYLGISSCCRASIAYYNDTTDIDHLIDGLTYVWSLFHAH